MNTLNISELFEKPKSIIVSGKPGTGKTTLIHHLTDKFLNRPGKGSYGIGFDYKALQPFPQFQVFHTYHEKWLPMVNDNNVNTDRLLVLDHNMSPPVFIDKEPALFDIFINKRHYNITTLYSTQWLGDVKPSVLENTSGVFIAKDMSPKTRECIYRTIKSMIPSMTFKDFCDSLDTLEAHEFIYINPESEGDWREHVYSYKVEL